MCSGIAIHNKTASWRGSSAHEGVKKKRLVSCVDATKKEGGISKVSNALMMSTVKLLGELLGAAQVMLILVVHSL
jgi:hypothetical protein